jgi:hypothetical protein
VEICKANVFQELVHSDQQFDLVILESLWVQEIFVGEFGLETKDMELKITH